MPVLTSVVDPKVFSGVETALMLISDPDLESGMHPKGILVA
jgi:hypothetical protein